MRLALENESPRQVESVVRVQYPHAHALDTHAECWQNDKPINNHQLDFDHAAASTA